MFVLIVAKCIVNFDVDVKLEYDSGVLIVAKCIVNLDRLKMNETGDIVLIVAKCIVNEMYASDSDEDTLCINSSKVYCKYTHYHGRLET